MKVFDPVNALVNFRFIPRRYNYKDLSYLCVSESTGEETPNEMADGLDTVSLDSLGYLSFNFYTRNKSITENNAYFTIKIFDEDGVIYRGKIFFTSQIDLQNYEIITVNENVIEL